MKAWKKGAILGVIISLILPLIGFKIFHFPGTTIKYVRFLTIQLIAGAFFGGLIGLSIEYYLKNPRNVSLKYPIIGFVLFFLIQYGFDVFNTFQTRPNRVSQVILLDPLFLLMNRQAIIINIFGLIFGYLIGVFIENKKNEGGKLIASSL